MKMANTTITMKSELRPCIVNGQKALFHCWEQYSQIVPPSPMRGGHGGGVTAQVVGIIEIEDGKVLRAFPSEIQFTDGKFKEEYHDNTRTRD